MKDYIILTDSTSNLQKDLRDKYNIEYVPMNYICEDVEYVASLDWEAHSPKEYYDLARSGKRVTSTQVPKHFFQESFRAAVEQGKGIIYIACSSALSGSVNIARTVEIEIKKENPDAEIFCIDALISSFGQGHLAIEASKMRAQGKSAKETADYIESIKLHMHQFGTVEKMDYLARAGRITASKAFFGNLFGVKPIIISDRLGQNFAYKKVKGMSNAIAAIADDVLDACEGVYDTLYLAHADNEKGIELLKKAILDKAPFKEVIIAPVCSPVGASVGPGTLIAYVYGKEVTIEGNE